jgi:GMP synthase (glutamine-hydrolysing)
VLVVVHHLRRPVLGHAGPALAAFGSAPIEVFRRDGDRLPPLDQVEAIVSFGGEQSVLDAGRDPVQAEEARWLAAAVRDRGIPVLGVCLGAQLLAHALGGRVARLPRRRVTWMALEPADAASGDPVLGALPPAAHGLHWNEDGFEPPDGSVELLRRDALGRCVAFRFGDAAWGVQFHPEIEPAALDHWYADWQPALAEAGVSEDDARALDRRHLPGQAALAEAVFGGFARFAARRAASVAPQA